MRNKYGIRFRVLVIPLQEGRRISEKAFHSFRYAGSAIQAKRFLSIVYPYPRYVIPDMPIPDLGSGR